MAHLTKASRQLFTRPPDERFASLTDLAKHCLALKERSTALTCDSLDCCPVFTDADLTLRLNGHAPAKLNDWSFTQLCGLAGASKDTITRLQPDTAAQALTELLDSRSRERRTLQALVQDRSLVRSLNGERYVRLWNSDLVAMLQEFATDFIPPPKGFNGATGLYAGEQDCFIFLIDPTGWIEIGKEAFAPGLFCWNSEVGRRTIGASTFWFQQTCANHIVWDATDVHEYEKRHVGKVGDALAVIRAMIERLVKRRDERKDQFVAVVKQAMRTTYAETAEHVEALLRQAGFQRTLAKRATELAKEKGRFTLWSVVDALTQLSREYRFAGIRTEADGKASALLKLVA